MFDDPNLVSCAGLAPAVALAERAGLHRLVTGRVHVAARGGANPAVKISSLVAGMLAGADSIDDMDLLRHGGMGRLFGGVRAPSTLGTFLRTLTFGHVRQLDSVAAGLLVGLAGLTPLLAGAGQLAYLDVDDTVKATYGYAKEGAGYGYSGVKGLNALIATLSSPIAAPVIVAARLRRGPTNSARGAARLISDAIVTSRRAGAGTGPAPGGLLIVRADSAFYNRDVIAAARRGGARFSVTARHDPAVVRAIDAIEESGWVPIAYPNAIWDEQERRWVSDAEVAEIDYTAFTSRPHAEQVTARLIVRRVRRLNNPRPPAAARPSCWRPTATMRCSPTPRC